MANILKRVDDRQTFLIAKDANGGFTITEECDGFFSIKLARDAIRQLAKEILIATDDEIPVRQAVRANGTLECAHIDHHLICVLRDGRTFTNLEDCGIWSVPKKWNTEQIEDCLADGLITPDEDDWADEGVRIAYFAGDSEEF